MSSRKRKSIVEKIKESTEDQNSLDEANEILSRIERTDSGQLSDKPTDKPNGKPTDKAINQATNPPADQSSGRSSGRSSDKPTDKATDKPTDKPNLQQYLRLNDRAFRILTYLNKYAPVEVSEQFLSSVLDIPYRSLVRARIRLTKKQYISATTYWDGPHTYKRFVIAPEIKQMFNDIIASDKPTDKATDKANGKATGKATDRSTGSQIDRSIYLSQEGGGVEGGDNSIVSKLLSLSDEDIQFHWPHLTRYGFSIHQIKQIVERLKQVDKSLDYIFRSLDFAEWELEHNKMADKNGDPVQDPNSFVFNSLAKNGYYRRPAGYVSPEEQAEEDARKEAERLKKAKEKKEQEEFEAWKQSLSKEEYDEIMKNRRGPEEIFLKHYWKTNIKH